jgi:hypothetical protein
VKTQSRDWPFLLILAAYLALALLVSVINPLFESTDEIRHYRYIRYLVVRRALPVQGAEAVRSQSHHPPLYYVLGALASGWVDSDHTPEYEQPLNPYWGYRNWAVGVDNKLQYLHSPASRSPLDRDYLAAFIPRWVNVLLGGLTVYLTYVIGLRTWPSRPQLAWGAAAVVGLNPQFIYLSAAMNNDVAAAAAGAAVTLACVGVVQQGAQRRRLVWLGLTYGLALMTKFHLLILGGVIALALGMAALREARGAAPRSVLLGRAGRRFLSGMGLVVAVATLLAGWWFVRNWSLYGDPTGLNKVNELWRGRPAAGNWWALQQGLPYLWSSLWGRFGYGQIPLPQAVYSGLFLVSLLALAGFAWGRLYDSGDTVELSGEAAAERGADKMDIRLIFVATVLGFAAVVTYYILIQPAGPMGRFLFPALPALAVLLVDGLNRWPILRRRPAWTAGGVVAGMLCLALGALGGYLWPAVRYPARAPEPPPGQPVAVRFDQVAQVLAVDVQPPNLQPGKPLFVSVTWRPIRQTPVPYAVYVHLIDEVGVLMAQRDTWPGLGRAPTTDWVVDRPLVDTYRVDLPESAYAPNRATIRVGLYEPTLGRLPLLGPRGESLGDGINVGEISVSPRPGPLPNPQQANFGNEIELVGYTLEPRALSPGGTFTLTLYWQPLGHPKQDYSVFAQVIDPAWRVWGSQDGAGPDWSAGGVTRDVRRITLLPDTPEGSYPVQVGLFHGETGRLPVIAPEGHYIDDRVLLGPVRVQK